MNEEILLLLRRVVAVMKSAAPECLNVGITCDVWEHDVDCTCLTDTIEAVIEGASKAQ